MKIKQIRLQNKKEKWELLLLIGKRAHANIKYPMSPPFGVHGRIALETFVVGGGHVTISGQWVLSVSDI